MLYSAFTGSALGACETDNVKETRIMKWDAES